MAKKKSGKKSGIEPFEDDVIDDDEINEDQEDTVASKNTAARKRRIEAEAEADDDVEADDEADEDEDEDEPVDEVDDDEDEDEAEEEDEESQPVGFAPFIIHENADWELVDVIDESDTGETLYFFRPPNDESPTARWYKLQPIEVGELGEITPAS